MLNGQCEFGHRYYDKAISAVPLFVTIKGPFHPKHKDFIMFRFVFLDLVPVLPIMQSLWMDRLLKDSHQILRPGLLLLIFYTCKDKDNKKTKCVAGWQIYEAAFWGISLLTVYCNWSTACSNMIGQYNFKRTRNGNLNMLGTRAHRL